jgi:serine/threonine protein kinase
MNYQHCLRLLGNWNVPDRSSRISDHPQLDEMAGLFIAAVDEEDSFSADLGNADLVAAIERLKRQIPECPGPKAELKSCEHASENSIVVLTKDPEGRIIAMKTANNSKAKEAIDREIKILKTMNHPLIAKIRDSCSGPKHQNSVIVTDFVANGSLTHHLPDQQNCDLYRLTGSTRIVRIIVGIVLAMRFIHSRGIVHGDLTPDNILLDLDWNVRICDFGQSIFLDQPKHCSHIDSNNKPYWPSAPTRYLAPECYNEITVPESDIFSFGMILYELIVGRPVFPKSMTAVKVVMQLMQDDWCPDIPDTVVQVTAELIRDCLALDYRDRPSFDDILERLKEMEFQLIAGVHSVRITEFVAAVEYWECLISIDNPDETSKATAFVNAGLFDERIHHLIQFICEHRRTDSRTSSKCRYAS